MKRALAVALLVVATSCAKKSDSIPDAGPAIVESTAPSPELKEKLGTALHTKDWPYIPNTRHKNADGSPKYTNRLILETSPYLLQHAHNPVNWFPWGDEAFALARRLGRPVFLSIGYSTCHWCHVMEEESFEDEEIARVLNEGYVPIKVDREERPDVDAIYISAVMALTGSGGWPTTLWLTPDREPFFGGTYFPARDGDRGSGMGLLTLLQSTRKTYDENPKNVTNAAARLVAAVRDHMKPELGGVVANAEILDAAAESYRPRFDETNGGPTGAPKFPSSMPVRFLLRQHRRTGNKDALRMASVTLERMADGGIHDHVGGGFHRYATDVDWRIPHFEKMLYDNALLTMAYLEGFQATRNPAFGRIARETLRYVEREMTSPNGAFYSATDADSLDANKHLEEGFFFTWTPDEIDAVLGAETGKKVSTYFNVTARGDVGGRSVLHLAHGVSSREAPKDIEAARTLLYDARAKRTAPRRDEKILTSWNGLMISAFARGSLVLGDAALAEKAVSAANVIITRSSNLSRTSHDDAYLDDYAFLIAGLLDLFEATGTRRWLDEAIRLDQVVEKHYEDTVGGFFLTSDTHEKLLAREKPSYDGAEPSGTSVHVLNLLRLAELTSKERYRTRSEYAIGSVAVGLKRDPTAMSEMLDALDFGLGTPKEIVIVTRGPRTDAEPLLAKLRETFLPNRVLVVASEASLADLASVIPLVTEKTARGAAATAYVCEKNTCQLPTSSPAVFATQLAKVKP